MGLDLSMGWRDRITFLSGILLIVLGVLAYLNISVPFLDWIVAAIFILGGLFAIFDAWDVYGVMKVVYMVLSLIVIILGVSVFYAIPFLGAVLNAVPVGITHYIVNAVVAVLLIVIAVHSN